LDPQRDLVKSFISFTPTVNHFPPYPPSLPPPLFLTLPIKFQTQTISFSIHKQNYQHFPKLFSGCRSALNFFFENATRTELDYTPLLTMFIRIGTLRLVGKHDSDRNTKIVSECLVSSSFYILLTEVSRVWRLWITNNKWRKKWGEDELLLLLLKFFRLFFL